MAASFRSGFVSIIGRPNVGKSTLLNRLVGEELAAVSRKPQTTRGVIHGILSTPKGQAVFLDTPGFHNPRDPLGRWMLGEIQKSLQDADLIYWMIFPEPPEEKEESPLAFFLSPQGRERGGVRGVPPLPPIFLLINQIDRVPKTQILPVIDSYQKVFPFREIIPLSALEGDNIPLLIRKTFETLPEHPAYFPEDELTDQNERTIAAEMIREKIFRFTGEEIPYSSAVEIEEFKERSERLVAIKAAVIVEKDSQKAILIGKGGSKIKEIGQEARKAIESFLGKKVFLELWVKVLKNWKKDPESLKRLGFGG